MHGNCLVAHVEAMNLAGRSREEWNVTQKVGAGNVAFEIERSNGGHGYVSANEAAPGRRGF